MRVFIELLGDRHQEVSTEGQSVSGFQKDVEQHQSDMCVQSQISADTETGSSSSALPASSFDIGSSDGLRCFESVFLLLGPPTHFFLALTLILCFL